MPPYIDVARFSFSGLRCFVIPVSAWFFLRSKPINSDLLRHFPYNKNAVRPIKNMGRREAQLARSWTRRIDRGHVSRDNASVANLRIADFRRLNSLRVGPSRRCGKLAGRTSATRLGEMPLNSDSAIFCRKSRLVQSRHLNNLRTASQLDRIYWHMTMVATLWLMFREERGQV